MFKHGWKVTVPITLVIMSIVGIGGYVLIYGTNFNYELGLEITSGGVKVNTQIDKGETSENTVSKCPTKKNITSSITNHQNKDFSSL